MNNMSHSYFPYFGRVKIGSNTALHCFVLQRKLSYYINVVYEIRRQQAKILYLTKRILAKDRMLSPYWKINLPPTTKRFNRSHTDNILENVCKEVLIMFWLYSWFLNLLPIPLSDIHNLNVFAVIIQYCVCVRSFKHICGGRKIVMQYGNSVQSFPRIVFSLVKLKVSGRQEQEQVLVAMEFTDQVSTFVELKLLWNR